MARPVSTFCPGRRLGRQCRPLGPLEFAPVDTPTAERPSPRGATERALAYLRALIASGRLEPGNRVPSERDLAAAVGVARPTVRSALRMLARAGIVRSVPGVGSFAIEPTPDRPRPVLVPPLLTSYGAAALDEMRRFIEGGGAALAAARATPEQCATIAEEVSNLFASLNDPQVFLVHDAGFRRAVGAASGNALIAAMVEQFTEAQLERVRARPPLATVDWLRHVAATHRRIYRAIRAHDADQARREMESHLSLPRAAAHVPVALVR